MATVKHKTNPYIPKPPHDELPDHEQLLTREHPQPSPVMMKQAVPMMVPNYNTLYDTLRSKGGWKYSADGFADGTLTTVAGTLVSVPVKLNLPANTQSPNWRLEQWPGGTALFLSIRSFAIAPQTATFATAGAIEYVFYDQFGNPCPLGIGLSNGNYTNNNLTLFPSPLTDSGQQTNLGTLQATLNSGATVGTYTWQIGFSAAYLLPAIKGYNLERIHEHVKEISVSHHHENIEHY